MNRKPTQPIEETERSDETTSVFLPQGWPRPKGYSNAVVLPRGRALCISGMVAWDANEQIVSSDFAEQFRQALSNVLECAKSAGSRADCIGRLTIFVADMAAYKAARPALGRIYRSLFGNHYPAMTLVEVKSLLEDGALVEIEAAGVVPD